MFRRYFARRRERQRAVVATITAVAVALGGLAAANGALDDSLQAAVYDTFVGATGASIGNQVTVVAVDDRTLLRYGEYPLPRRAYADVLRALGPHAPKTVLFDVGFYDPSPDPAQDRALADAIGEAGNVILAMQGVGGGERGGGALRVAEVRLPIAPLREAAAGLGAVNLDPDPDGRARRAQLVIEGPDGRYHAMPLVAAARHLGADIASLRLEDGRLLLPAAGFVRSLPIDEGGGMYVYYAGPPATHTAERGPDCDDHPAELCVVSLSDVVAGAVDGRFLTGRTVYVGVHSLSGVADAHFVPASGGAKMYGAEIWANATNTILTNRFPALRQDLTATLAQIALVTLLGVLLVVRLRAAGFVLALAALGAYGLAQFALFAVATGGAFSQGDVVVPSLGYLAPAAVWWVVALGYLLVEGELALARAQRTFGRFVTPSVARTILDLEEAGSLHLGGEDRKVTVLFGDVRGFTTMSEGMRPTEVLDTLNRYFDGIVDIVDRFEGTVNKYNGDSIMVIWGAPLEVRDQARKAVECALELQRWIVAERARGGPDVAFGFGINTGRAVAGFLGAKGRMEYTVVGDVANVASRLTSSEIARRDDVVVSAATLGELGGDAETTDLGAFRLKGRTDAVACHRVLRLGASAGPDAAGRQDATAASPAAGYP